MSGELNEMKKKIAIARRRHADAEQSRSRDRQGKIIAAASEKKQKYEEAKALTAASRRRMDALFSMLKFGAAACLCIFSVFIASKVFSAPKSDFTVTVKGDERFSSVASEKAERVFMAFRDKSDEEICALSGRLDEMGRQDCENVFSGFESLPDFKTAKVESPKTDPDLYYVYVPAPNSQRLQFVMRNINGDIVFEGICIDE